MHKLYSIFFLLVFPLFGSAQELNCEVKVTFENIQQTDPSVFRNLEQKISAFLNERRWTNDQFDPEERIDCSFYLNILSEVSQNRFKAQAVIKSTRPVYNSTYETVVLDVIDNDFEFEFDPFTVIEFRKNEFVDNLSSSLSFYALTIVALDYDSFAMNSGSRYHNEANRIVRQAASSPFPGWNQSNTNNRGNVSKYWISQNLTENRFYNFKREFFNYHRNVLDQLYDEPQQSWKNMESVITNLEKVHEQNRNLQIMYLFFDAKGEEIVKVMDKATPAQKRSVSEKCMAIDPINTKIYRTLTK